MQQTHVLVRGRVQGVGYRAFVEQQAALHRISGWVRNRRDGSVEAVLVGEPEAVGRMLHTLRRGPPLAVVDGLMTGEWTGHVGAGFELRPTE